MGSGSVGLAAMNQGCGFWGNDICDEAVQITTERLILGGYVEDINALPPVSLPSTPLLELLQNPQEEAS
jgi:hypothetical protein